MTFEEIDQMPLLIRRKDMVRLTGWHPETIRCYVSGGQLTPVRPPGMRKGLWRKYEVLTLAQIPFDSAGRVLRAAFGQNCPGLGRIGADSGTSACHSVATVQTTKLA